MALSRELAAVDLLVKRFTVDLTDLRAEEPELYDHVSPLVVLPLWLEVQRQA